MGDPIRAKIDKWDPVLEEAKKDLKRIIAHLCSHPLKKLARAVWGDLSFTRKYGYRCFHETALQWGWVKGWIKHCSWRGHKFENTKRSTDYKVCQICHTYRRVTK